MISRNIPILYGFCILLALLGIGMAAYLLKQAQVEHRRDVGRKLSEGNYTLVDDQYHRIHSGAFDIQTPQSFRLYISQGIDSYVGQITDGVDTYFFDYGWYSNDLSSIEEVPYLRCWDNIHGKGVFVVVNDSGELGNVGVYFPEAHGTNHLQINGKKIQNMEAGLDMLASIQFPSSIPQPREHPLGTNCQLQFNPKVFLSTHCWHCHHLSRRLVGPPLGGLAADDLEQWLQQENETWVPSPDPGIELTSPSWHQTLIGKSEITPEQIRKVWEYLEGHVEEIEVVEVME